MVSGAKNFRGCVITRNRMIAGSSIDSTPALPSPKPAIAAIIHSHRRSPVSRHLSAISHSPAPIIAVSVYGSARPAARQVFSAKAKPSAAASATTHETPARRAKLVSITAAPAADKADSRFIRYAHDPIGTTVPKILPRIVYSG